MPPGPRLSLQIIPYQVFDLVSGFPPIFKRSRLYGPPMRYFCVQVGEHLFPRPFLVFHPPLSLNFS